MPKPVYDVTDQRNLQKSEHANRNQRCIVTELPTKRPGNRDIALTHKEGKKEEEQRPSSLDYTYRCARNEA